MDSIHKLFRAEEKPLSRRAALRAAGCGFGWLGLAGLLAQESAVGADGGLHREAYAREAGADSQKSFA